MGKDSTNEYAYLWTTEKDDYCLVEPLEEAGLYTICEIRRAFILIIEFGEIYARGDTLDYELIVRNIKEAGARIFSDSAEWIRFVSSQPGYQAGITLEECKNSPFYNPTNPMPDHFFD